MSTTQEKAEVPFVCSFCKNPIEEGDLCTYVSFVVGVINKGNESVRLAMVNGEPCNRILLHLCDSCKVVIMEVLRDIGVPIDQNVLELQPDHLEALRKVLV